MKEKTTDMEQVPVDKVEKRPYRTVLAERFREEYPDDAVDYGDDEAFFGALERYDSGRDKLIEGYAENSKRLSALFNENPQAGAFITSLMNGSDVLDAIAGSFGADFEAALKDPEARKRYDEGIARWRADREATEEILRKQEENADLYADEVERFFTEKALGEGERESFARFVSGLIDKLTTYEMTSDVLEMLWRSYKYKEDIAAAEETGEIRGRNENIVMSRGLEDETDGLPMTSRTGLDGRDPYDYMERVSIWDRG